MSIWPSEGHPLHRSQENSKILRASSLGPALGCAIVAGSSKEAGCCAGELTGAVTACRHCGITGVRDPSLLQGGAPGWPADAALPGVGHLCPVPELHTHQPQPSGMQLLYNKSSYCGSVLGMLWHGIMLHGQQEMSG